MSVKRYVPYSKGAVLEYVEGMDAGCIPMVLASDYDALQARVAKLEAALEEAMEWNWQEYAYNIPQHVIEQIEAARAAVNQSEGRT